MHSPGPAGVGTSRVSTPLAPTPNWRNPALYFSSATAAGARAAGSVRGLVYSERIIIAVYA